MKRGNFRYLLVPVSVRLSSHVTTLTFPGLHRVQQETVVEQVSGEAFRRGIPKVHAKFIATYAVDVFHITVPYTAAICTIRRYTEQNNTARMAAP